MSLSSTSSFNVQIDSQYRDISKYPTFTDFGIKFKNTNTGTAFNGNPLNNYTNIQTQIDPDFINASFRVINGSLQHIQRDVNGNFYISGTIDKLQLGSEFKILQGNYRIFTLPANTIPNVFIGKFTPLSGGNFYLSWLCYLQPKDNTTYRLSPTRSTLEIDISENIYWTFDCSFNDVNVFSTLNGIMYNIMPQNNTQRQYQVICAFDNIGSEYIVNGIPWGYHILSSENDLLLILIN